MLARCTSCFVQETIKYSVFCILCSVALSHAGGENGACSAITERALFGQRVRPAGEKLAGRLDCHIPLFLNGTPVWQPDILTRPERNMTISRLWVNCQCAGLYPGLRTSPQYNAPAPTACCTTSWDRPNLEIWATTTWNSKLSYAISRLACDWYRHLTATQRIMTGARSLMSVSCHDSSLPSKRIWWHIMTQGYLQMYKMIWNCVIGNFIVGKKLQLLCLFDQSAAAHLRWNADGRHRGIADVCFELHFRVTPGQFRSAAVG